MVGYGRRKSSIFLRWSSSVTSGQETQTSAENLPPPHPPPPFNTDSVFVEANRSPPIYRPLEVSIEECNTPANTLPSIKSYTKPSSNRNRALSIRPGGKGSSSATSPPGRKGFSFASLRGVMQPELSKKLYQVIKTQSNLISAHDSAAKERTSIATQLSEWGEQTQDENVSDISDKIGVILAELGEQEEAYAHNLEDARGTLKSIRNTEKSVQPSRDSKAKISDDIQKLKLKEPQSTKLVVLEQELVRAEAENLVAEAQLSNVTREKLKEAYDAEFAAVIERAEKQIILAQHGRRLLSLLDTTPMTPGDAKREYPHGAEARQILNDAEDDLRKWEPSQEVEPAVRDSGFTEQSSVATGAAPAADDTYASATDDGLETAQPTGSVGVAS